MTTGEAPARVIFERPALLGQKVTHYCPGCGHGVVHRLVAEVLEELGVAGRTIAVAAVGCAVFAYDYLRVDFVEAQHHYHEALAMQEERHAARPLKPFNAPFPVEKQKALGQAMMEALGFDFILRIKSDFYVADDKGTSKSAKDWVTPSGRAIAV